MIIKNDVAHQPLAGKLMHALRTSGSRRLEQIWKEKKQEQVEKKK